MRETKVGQRIVYEHADHGGINALVTAVLDDEVVNLVFVNPEGKVETLENIPNVYQAKELKEVDQLIGGKLEKVEKPCSIANGFWRR